MKVLARNYRCPDGEADMIALDGSPAGDHRLRRGQDAAKQRDRQPGVCRGPPQAGADRSRRPVYLCRPARPKNTPSGSTSWPSSGRRRASRRSGGTSPMPSGRRERTGPSLLEQATRRKIARMKSSTVFLAAMACVRWRGPTRPPRPRPASRPSRRRNAPAGRQGDGRPLRRAARQPELPPAEGGARRAAQTAELPGRPVEEIRAR